MRVRTIYWAALIALLLSISTLTVLHIAQAQQTTGTPGSPTATGTVNGRYLPAPAQKFEGEIGLNALQSKPAWPARIVPPKGAPNILLIMTDDVGFAALSTFGGVIPTPAFDSVAAAGLRTNFHFTALCSPTRFDIAADTGSPVDDRDYQPPFNFTGKIDKLTIAIDRPVLSQADIQKLQTARPV